MTQYFVFLVLGIGAGTIYAGLALGLVVQFKASGVLNLSHGAVAMIAAYQYDELRKTGNLVLPWIGLPHTVHIADGLAIVPAMAIVLTLTAGLGLAIHQLVFHPLRHAPALAKVVASVGLMLVLQALVIAQFGVGYGRQPGGLLPAQPVHVFGTAVPRDRLFLAAITVGMAVIVWGLFRFSWFGLATRAAAESDRGAQLIGLRPKRYAAACWAASSVLAGLFGILIAPITSLDPVKFTLFIVPALAAALIGRLTLVSLATIGGLALGMTQSELLFLTTKKWFPEWARSGAVDLVPFVAIVLALFIAGRRLPVRGAAAGAEPMRSLRTADRPRTTFVWLGAGLGALLVLQGAYRLALVQTFIGVILLLSLVVLVGYVGQISLAQAAFAGTGGFLLSRLADGHGVPFPLAPLLAAACAAVVGCVVGIPALRVRGVQLAVVTLAGAIAVEQVVFKNPTIAGGELGAKVPDASFLGLDLGARTGDAQPSIAFGVTCLVVVGLLALMVGNIRRSSLGRRMLAVRSNERAAAAIGIDVVKVKVGAFAISSFIAGVGGAMTGYSQSSLSAQSFTVYVGISLLATAYLAGITSVSGAFVGGILINGGLLATFAGEKLSLGKYYLLISGVAVLVTAVLNPEGITAAVTARVQSLGGSKRRGKAVASRVPPLIADRLGVPQQG
ncbi:MAG: lptB 5 [Ilumatobacteraceae bacterium]|nr:lptB 5 [Ilumatobacteraceae bacterium]